jgi:predicted CoA-binding protein
VEGKNTLVLGASLKDWRISHEAVLRLTRYGHPVVAVGLREGKIGAVDIIKEPPAEKDFDTVTLYLNAQNQKKYYDYILSINVKRIIFNPGAENPELAKLAQEKGIETIEACTLTMLASRLY